MRFFGGGDGESPQRGPVSPAAHARLAELTGAGGLFTSTLSVGEFAALAELGCVPLGQVFGVSVYQGGWQYLAPEAQWGGEVFCGAPG